MLSQIIFNGIAVGSIYILAGLSFGIIFTTARVFHFAHVAVYTLGGFFFFQMIVLWQQPFIISFLGGILLSCIVGLGIELVCYQPLRRLQATPLQLLITAIGVTTVLQNITLLIWKTEPQVVPISIELLKGHQVGGVWISYFQVFTLLAVACIWAALHLFIMKSKMGKAIRAFSADPKTLELMGINPRGIRVIVYAIGSSMICIAAYLQIMEFGMDVTTGLGVVLIGIIATLTGAAWGLTGIAVSSLCLGIIENLGTAILSSQWKYCIIFGAITILLVIRPKFMFR